MAKNLTAALALVGASAAAGATPVTISQTVTLSQLLAGNSASLSFDINAQLHSFGLGAGDITSGELVVYGYSDAQYNASTADPYGEYVATGTRSHLATTTVSYPYYVSNCYSYYSFWSGRHYTCNGPGYTAWASYSYDTNVTDTDTVRSRDVHRTDDVRDTMTVSAGGSSATGSVEGAMHTVRTGEYGAPMYERTDGDYYTGYLYRYNRERDVYEAIAGTMQAGLQLDAGALAELTAGGSLEALVSSTLGHVDLRSATLTVLAEARAQAGSSVPEPGSLALMALAGAGGLAARRRKRSK